MDRPDVIAALCRLLLRHLVEQRERLLDRIDVHHWKAEVSRELTVIDEALTRQGYFDTE